MNLKEFMHDVVLNWITRRDNPNQVTAAQAGAYDKDEIDQKLSLKLPVGVLPLYAYGDATDNPVEYNTVGGMLRFPADVPVLFYGTPYKAPGSSMSMPDGKKYVTCELNNGYVTYQQYDTKPTNTPTRIHIGEYEMLNDEVSSVTLFKARGAFTVDAPV